MDKQEKETKYEYLKILTVGTIDEQYKAMLNELVYDVKDIHIQFEKDYDKGFSTINDKEEIELMFEMISKYGYFIYHLEKEQEYEKCGELMNMLPNYFNLFGYGFEQVKELIQNSITRYNEKELDEE